MYGFSCLRFLSRFSKTGLGIVPFGGTRELHTYTFKQPILPAAAFQAAFFAVLKSSLMKCRFRSARHVSQLPERFPEVRF